MNPAARTASVPDPIRTSPRPACYLCGKPGALLYSGMRDRVYDIPGEWSLRRCPGVGCGLVWLDPCPVPEDIGKLYRTYYTHTANTGVLKKVNRWFARAVLSDRLGYPSSGIADRLVGRVLSRVGVVRDMMEASALWQPAGKGKLLDVGCGSGEFLRWMRDLGWDVYGVEPDPAGAEVARGGNIPVRVGTVQQADFPADEFDLVTLSHVLEHLPDPIATITECRRILKPGGRLVAVTPNTGSRASRRYRRHWMGCEVPRHLMLFNTDSIREVAARASIKVVAVRTCARTARWIFRVSNCLTRMPHLPGAVCPHEPWLLPPAMLFQLGEHGALARDAGEELVLVAER